MITDHPAHGETVPQLDLDADRFQHGDNDHGGVVEGAALVGQVNDLFLSVIAGLGQIFFRFFN